MVRERLRNAGEKKAFFLVVVLLFLFLAVFFTRPILLQGNHATYKDPYDPTLQAWTLAWDIHALGSNPLNLFNANIFYPNHNTLSYSDHQITNGVLAIPVMAVTRNPVYTQNLLLIFNVFLCALGAYFLTTHLTKSRTAGVFAGIIFAFAPPRLAHMGHLNLISAGWMPLALLFLHKYSEEGRTRDVVLFALFFVIQTLASWHYGIILAVAVALFLLVRLIMKPRGFTLRWVGVFLAAVFIAALVIAPFAVPYFKLNKSDPRFKRTLDEVDLFSVDVKDFAIAPAENLFWGKLTAGLREGIAKRAGPTERSMFPGLIPLVLGIGGAIYLFRRGRGEERFYVRYYVPLAALSAVLCLGSTLYLFGHRFNIPMPYELFFYLFPGFKAMRVPGRFIILTLLSLAILSGFAIKAIMEWAASKRGISLSATLGVVLLVLLLLDMMSASLPMYRVPLKGEFPPVYSWLKEQKGQAPTVELPLADYNPHTFKAGLQYEPTWIEREAMRTYYSTLHWKKTFNGFSGYIPTSYYQGVKATRGFPSKEAMEFFRGQGVKYLLVHGAQFDSNTLDRILQWDKSHGDIELVRRFGSDYVFRLKA
jgi:hypothetical protein